MFREGRSEVRRMLVAGPVGGFGNAETVAQDRVAADEQPAFKKIFAGTDAESPLEILLELALADGKGDGERRET